ncbi:DUF4286 family protein [Carboxylicivirga linearis]|uniref:DUF4286 family protein n=1 Tax=Carboxylicivirga linearis TaxID=1628157 RepID=A0ABS5JQ44_9BACT|nr:DUF4286 family protein [Carboxylicivirga linearis]MBS2096994.1 DUF4286 family protein [Carboxylicivirga linearis]
MFIFNTTFSVENNSIENWRSWMDRNYLPTMQDMIKGIRVELYEVMAVVHEESTNFSCQLLCKSPEELETINKYNTILMDNLKGHLGEKCLHFSSILKEI